MHRAAGPLRVMRNWPLHDLHVLAYKKPFIFIYIPVRSAGGGLHGLKISRSVSGGIGTIGVSTAFIGSSNI